MGSVQPVYPFTPVQVILPDGVVNDPLENLLVMAAINAAYIKPVTFKSWLSAREAEESPAGDIARDAAQVVGWDGSPASLRKVICPDAYEPEGPCPTTNQQNVTAIFDGVVKEFDGRK